MFARWKDKSLDAVDIIVGVATPLGAIVLVVLARAGIVKQDMVPIWIVPILAAIAINGLFDRYRRLAGIDRSLQTALSQLSDLGARTRGIDFHPSRTDSPRFKDLAERATSDVLLVMLAPAYLTFYERDRMRRLAERGVTLRFLLPSPTPHDEADHLLQRIGRLCDDSDYPNVLRDFLRNLLTWRGEQAPEVASRIQVRTYDFTYPSLNVLVVDRGKGESPLWIELMPQGFDPMERPSLSIDRRYYARELHDRIVDVYEQLWNDAQHYDPTPAAS